MISLNEDGNICDNPLLEAKFTNISNLDKHYGSHVLKPEEEFNFADPKFPANMTKEQYAKRAEALTNSLAGRSDSSERIVGWIASNPAWRNPRYIKFFKKSTYNNACSEMVAYVVEDGHPDEIVSYYLARPSKFKTLLAQKVAELPENQTDEEKSEWEKIKSDAKTAHQTYVNKSKEAPKIETISEAFEFMKEFED